MERTFLNPGLHGSIQRELFFLNTLSIFSQQVAVMGAKGAVSILYRGAKNVEEKEEEYIDDDTDGDVVTAAGAAKNT